MIRPNKLLHRGLNNSNTASNRIELCLTFTLSSETEIWNDNTIHKNGPIKYGNNLDDIVQ